MTRATPRPAPEENERRRRRRTVLAGGGSAGAEPRRRLTALFLVTSLHGGGAEWVGRMWMEWLVRRGHDVLVVTTSDKVTGEFVPGGVRSMPLGHLRSHAAKVRALRVVLRDGEIDVVVGMQMYPNLIAVAAAMSLPAVRRPAVIVSEHNLVTYGLPGAAPSHRVKTWLSRHAYPMADHVIAVSHAVAGEMVGGFGVREGRCSVIPNPAASKVPVRPVLVAERDVEIDLVIAHRLVPQKRPQLAIRVAAELRRRGRSVRLTVFGQGPLEQAMVDLATELDVDLDRRGWAEQWFDACTDRSVLLLASHREGFGNVLVEAAAAGIPSVALSSALGVADAVIPGITGELALSDRVTDIADAVERAARVRIGDVGPWLDRFSAATSGAALERVVASVVRA